MGTVRRGGGSSYARDRTEVYHMCVRYLVGSSRWGGGQVKGYS